MSVTRLHFQVSDAMRWPGERCILPQKRGGISGDVICI